MNIQAAIPELVGEKIPQHIAIIMDGNGRWAQAHGKKRTAGHKQGVEAVRRTVENCVNRGVNYLTLFAFSSENWQRPEAEVSILMELLAYVLKHDIQRIHKNDVRLNVIGDISRFSSRLQKLIKEGLELTSANSTMTLTLAINYGSRWEMVEAVRKIARQVQAGELAPDAIDEPMFSASLATAGLPDPDLLVRTSGEIRISNFLLWQIAYTELYFTDLYWPDFDAKALDNAIAWYAKRQRRFGKTGEQIKTGEQMRAQSQSKTAA